MTLLFVNVIYNHASGGRQAAQQEGSQVFSRSLKLALVGALFLGLASAKSTSASIDSTHVNFLTFSRGVSLPGGVHLAAGTYRFEVESASQGGVVRVSSRNSDTVYLTAFTHDIDRPRGDNQAVVTLDDVASVGMAVTAWFPIGESIGHQFVYGSN
jgi:hypothetical protein